LDTYSSRMRFFSLVPETDKDVHDVDVSNMAARELLFASGRVASLVDGSNGNADVVEVKALVGCLIDCLGFDLFLMTKELCSLLLSPCSNEGSFGRDHLRRRWRSRSWQGKMNISGVIRTVLSERCKANLTNPRTS
jgi:hypothetical protein